ncbi:MAG: HYR domain-containing protein, partial [candidate division Zixibacteria bacterium]
MNNRSIKILLAIVIMIIGLFTLLTCSRRIVNPDDSKSANIAIAIETSSALRTYPNMQFELTISADDMDTMSVSLELIDGFIVGEIDSIPSGENRHFVLECFDIGFNNAESPIYRGEAFATITQASTLNLTISLSPQVPMLRMTNVFHRLDPDSSFVETIKIYQLPGLASIQFDLTYDSDLLTLDSVRVHPDIASGAELIVDSGVVSGTIGLTISADGGSLVDGTGFGQIGEAFFTSNVIPLCFDTSTILVVGSIEGQELYNDGAVIESRGFVLDAAPDTMHFGFGVAGLNLNAQTLIVSDYCNLLLRPYSFDFEAEWLVISPESPSSPGSHAVSATVPASFEVGSTYVETVYISSPFAADAKELVVTMIVGDTIPPTIICPTDTTVACGGSTDPEFTGFPEWSDNIDTNLTPYYADENFGNGLFVRTWTVTDNSGNSASCEQDIQTGDTQPPVITCPSNTTVACFGDIAPENTESATATDDCGTIASITYTDLIYRDTVYRTWTEFDAVGKQAQCLQTITISDTSGPVISCSESFSRTVADLPAEICMPFTIAGDYA